MNDKQLYSVVRTTIRRYDMLRRGDRVLIALSGGADSVFLVRALVYLGREYDLDLAVAHLEHGIRGKDSLNDLVFCRGLAKRYGLPFVCKRMKVRKRKGHSLEETARDRRYVFFEEIARQRDISRIATAHTADDQAETVLMRVIKGTSLKGMTGIPPVRSAGRFSYIRPLIAVEKKEVIASLRRQKIGYRIDRTNADNAILRNAVRNRILPYLMRYNARLKRSLANLAETLREDRLYIEGEKRRIVASITKESSSGAVPIDLLRREPAALQKEIIREFFAMKGGNVKKLTFRHWQEIRECITARHAMSIDLPGNIRLRKDAKAIVIAKRRGR